MLQVDSCVYVGMHGFLRRRFIAFVSFPKASMPPSTVRTFADRLVKPTSVVHTREAVPLGQDPTSVLCSLRPGTSHLWRARRGREASSPHRPGPCCHRSVEVHG